ncbi:hypothetical protein AB0C04_05455 [Micromonospora sp. NPDC048909]
MQSATQRSGTFVQVCSLGGRAGRRHTRHGRAEAEQWADISRSTDFPS